MRQGICFNVDQLRLGEIMVGGNTIDGVFNKPGSTVEQMLLVADEEFRGASPVVGFQVMINGLLGVSNGFILSGDLRMQLTLGFLAFDLAQFTLEEVSEEIAQLVLVSF